MRYRGLQALGLFLTLLLLFIHSLHAQQSDWSGVNDNWRPVGGFFPPVARVSATSRSPGNLDLFITGNDGRIYTSWWYEGNDWSGVNDSSEARRVGIAWRSR